MKDQTTGLTLVEHSVRLEKRENASLILTSEVPLDPVVAHTGIWLEKWAAETPDTVFLAERDGAGWR